MKTHAINSPNWSTASFGDSTESSSLEFSGLKEHLDLCKKSCGRLFALQCLSETMNGFMAPRFVTTLFVAALFMGIGSMVL